MASAPPQLPPASSLDPNIKPNPRFKNNWSQIVRGDADPSPPPDKQQQHQQPKLPPEHPHRQSQPQPQPPQHQQQHLLLPESAVDVAAMIPTVSAATESASGMLVPTSDSLASHSPAACSSEKKQLGDSLPEDSESVIDKPDRSEVDASGGEITPAKAGTPETSAKVTKPAWRMLPANAGKNSEPGLVMGAVSWPALGDARSTKSSEPPSPILASAAGQRAGPKATPASPGREGSTAQASLSESSIHFGASGNGSDSPTGFRQKSAIKRGAAGNGMAPFWEPAPPEKVSSSMIGHSADVVPTNQSVKGSGESGTKAVLATTGTGDQGRVFHQRGEGGVSFPNLAGNRRNNMRDQGRGNHGWHSQNRGYMNGRDYGLALQQQRIGPRNLPRLAHPFMTAAPGFINATGFPSGMYYVPGPVPDPLLGAAYFVPPASPGVLMHGPDPIALRGMLVKQIEYYFSVENLCRDVYLRSNMDKQGFVPISVIANFNRVRMLTPNPNVIVDSLRKSTVVEVQGERIRKRDDWAKWILPSIQYDSVTSSQEDPTERNFNAPQEDRKGGAKSYIPVKKDHDNKTRLGRSDCRHDDAVITSLVSLPKEQPRRSENSDGLGVLEDSCVDGVSGLPPCVMEVKSDDVSEYSCISGRFTVSEGVPCAPPNSMQSDVKSAARHGFVGDWGVCLPSDDRRSVQGSNIVSHLRSVTKTAILRKEDPLTSIERATLPHVEEVKSECHLLSDQGYHPTSCSSEDEKDSEITKDFQRFSSVAQVQKLINKALCIHTCVWSLCVF